MDNRLNNVDTLLEQAGCPTSSLKASDSVQEEAETLTAGFSSARAGSVTDLDADLLGVKLDDCSRYFKKEVMVIFAHPALDSCSDHYTASTGLKDCAYRASSWIRK